MSWRTDLFTRVTGIGAISTLISTRFYWLQLPSDPTYPAIHYFAVTGKPLVAHDGPSGYESVLVQFDILAKTAGDCEGVGEALKANLNGTRSAGLSVILDDEGDLFEDADDLWRIRQDYLVMNA